MASAGGLSTVGSTFLPTEPDAARISPLSSSAAPPSISRPWPTPRSSDAGYAPGPSRSTGAVHRANEAGVDGLYVCAGHGPWGISIGPASAADRGAHDPRWHPAAIRARGGPLSVDWASLCDMHKRTRGRSTDGPMRRRRSTLGFLHNRHRAGATNARDQCRRPPGCLPRAQLVMLMTPGLAFFYGGLVRRKNVLSTIMHSFFILGLVSVIGCSGATRSPSAPTTRTRAHRRPRLAGTRGGDRRRHRSMHRRFPTSPSWRLGRCSRSSPRPHHAFAERKR